MNPKDAEKYRDFLVSADHDASRDFDTAVLSLGSGALALSATFAHDIAPHPVDVNLAAISWALLTVSVIATLTSFITSQKALRKTMTDLDAGEDLPLVPGGTSSRWTKHLNSIAGGALVLGLISLALFAWANLQALN